MKPPAHQVSKLEAEYGKGMKSAHCGICRHFGPPHDCEVVIGTVNSDGWCKYFASGNPLKAN